MKIVNVSLTENQASVLLQLLDLAVKNNGLNVAEPAVVLAKLIQDAQRRAVEPPKEEPLLQPTE